MNSSEIIIRRQEELTKGDFLCLNGYNVQRIVYELIKNYMMANTPASCGITLAQTYDLDITKSSIFLDISYNWKTQAIDKVPAIYVQRGDIEVKSPTIGQSIGGEVAESQDERLTINTMPIIVTCVAASPIAVVENLAEYVKQPLLSYRKEIRQDFKLRQFKLDRITSPAPIQEGKTNFFVNILLSVVFDESWIVERQDLKLKECTIIFDGVASSCSCGS